ncbi:hypothetical protein GW17_00015419 [Ensete ventricosum]|nr:hypothetical protein GW17_00015419 [Ensete ventricosum]RZR92681.1 hypothetical protein BHM03_00021025 [Ensete ventricosum]
MAPDVTPSIRYETILIDSPAKRGPGNQRGQQLMQNHTCRSTEGVTLINNLDTTSLRPSGINTLTVANSKGISSRPSTHTNSISYFHTPRNDLAIGGATSGTHHLTEAFSQELIEDLSTPSADL